MRDVLQLGVSGSLSLQQRRGARVQETDELRKDSSMSCLPARKCLETSSMGLISCQFLVTAELDR